MHGARTRNLALVQVAELTQEALEQQLQLPPLQGATLPQPQLAMRCHSRPLSGRSVVAGAVHPLRSVRLAAPAVGVTQRKQQQQRQRRQAVAAGVRQGPSPRQLRRAGSRQAAAVEEAETETAARGSGSSVVIEGVSFAVRRRRRRSLLCTA